MNLCLDEIRDLIAVAKTLNREDCLSESEVLVRVAERSLDVEGREIPETVPRDIRLDLEAFRDGFTMLRGAGWRRRKL